ncbi:phosphate ABC transporter permease subunit PstC [Bacillus kwashiorkori]|uniref:phosphate ABC transporter permease subunit PstC n=1 Tax=Bacillus kwashiorkori TaxID=1522318 RepID=UPI00078195A4|nr:phosphate ABC transporter permease subunit PstC [Bacillus kwashiorkori]
MSKEILNIDKYQTNKSNRKKYILEKLSGRVFLFCALISVISLILIIAFVFYKGSHPFVAEGYSFLQFLTGKDWVPSEDKYGVLPMIVASIFGTIGALIIGVPIGLFTAILLAEIVPKPMAKIISSAVQLLAGIPSVLYGVFGLAVIVPFLQNSFGLAKGQSLIAVIFVLAIMMLPTVVTVAETAIRAVPQSYREGSLALGVSEIGTIFKVVIPAAKSGIMTAIVLGMGRAIGETMAVILVAGNSLLIPTSLTDSVRPLTTNIALEMGYASGIHQEMLFATGIILFSFILILNFVLARLSAKGGH